jgi:hypothetical protein
VSFGHSYGLLHDVHSPRIDAHGSVSMANGSVSMNDEDFYPNDQSLSRTFWKEIFSCVR